MQRAVYTIRQWTSDYEKGKASHSPSAVTGSGGDTVASGEELKKNRFSAGKRKRVKGSWSLTLEASDTYACDMQSTSLYS